MTQILGASKVAAAVAALLATSAVVATTGPAQAAKVQVTKAEYKKVKLDMTQGKVTKIVASKGILHHGDDYCMVKKYTGGNGTTVYFKFEDGYVDGVRTLVEKVRLGPLGGLYPVCPSVS